jgi:hypothetical protein
VVVEEEAAMAELSERHEVRVRGRNGPIVVLADSQDGRLVIRQEPDGHRAKDVCSRLRRLGVLPAEGDRRAG